MQDRFHYVNLIMRWPIKIIPIHGWFLHMSWPSNPKCPNSQPNFIHDPHLMHAKINIAPTYLIWNHQKYCKNSKALLMSWQNVEDPKNPHVKNTYICHTMDQIGSTKHVDLIWSLLIKNNNKNKYLTSLVVENEHQRTCDTLRMDYVLNIQRHVFQ